MKMMAKQNKFIILVSAIILMLLLFETTLLVVISAEPVEDKKALIGFIQSINNKSAAAASAMINWDMRSSACVNWTGITCNHDGSRIIALQLPPHFLSPDASANSTIPPNTLSRLSDLQILSLGSNGLTGLLPSDFSNLTNLKALHLQSNGFFGPLLLDFSSWYNLSVLDLSNNGFNGSIPPSISSLTHLTALNLANNSFSGGIPSSLSNIPSLQLVDLSNNNLTGPIPPSLEERFPGSAFAGNNINLTSTHPSTQPYSSSQKKSTKLGEPLTLGILIGGCVLAFVLFALMMIFCHAKQEQEEGKLTKLRSESSQNVNENGLMFFEGGIAFDLEDLLRASGELLGKGTFGAAYKATLEDAAVVVVKRLKQVMPDFELQMEVVGNIRHQNVVPLRAYYYSKHQNLMVYDYFHQGSVSSLLHANRDGNLDWDSRLQIAIGAARGIAYIHTQSGGKFVHGNIKTSNIFLNAQRYGCLSDIGLPPVMAPLMTPVMRFGGYWAPEVVDTRKVSQPADVYSFGVVLLELLTGKSPAHANDGEEVVHLVRWVHSVIREEWTAEVFDVELLKYPNIEGEMVEMLQIGMRCVARSPEQRPRMADVVRLVEDIRRNTNTCASETSTPLSVSPVTMTAQCIGSSVVTM